MSSRNGPGWAETRLNRRGLDESFPRKNIQACEGEGFASLRTCGWSLLRPGPALQIPGLHRHAVSHNRIGLWRCSMCQHRRGFRPVVDTACPVVAHAHPPSGPYPKAAMLNGAFVSKGKTLDTHIPCLSLGATRTSHPGPPICNKRRTGAYA